MVERQESTKEGRKGKILLSLLEGNKDRALKLLMSEFENVCDYVDVKYGDTAKLITSADNYIGREWNQSNLIMQRLVSNTGRLVKVNFFVKNEEKYDITSWTLDTETSGWNISNIDADGVKSDEDSAFPGVIRILAKI